MEELRRAFIKPRTLILKYRQGKQTVGVPNTRVSVPPRLSVPGPFRKVSKDSYGHRECGIRLSVVENHKREADTWRHLPSVKHTQVLGKSQFVVICIPAFSVDYEFDFNNIKQNKIQ